MSPMKIERPLASAVGVVCLATLLAYGGRWSWFCELFVNFRTHCALVLAFLLIAAAVARYWRIAGIAVLGLALNLWPMAGAFPGAAPPPPSGARAVRVVEFNVYVKNRNLTGIAAYLDSLAPDVIVLEEVTTSSADRLTQLLARYGHRYLAVDERVRGVLILSRWPLVAPQRVERNGLMFGARADVDFGDRRLRLYGLHLDWPVIPAAADNRNAQLLDLGRKLADCHGACAAVGDFNTTPWSSHFRDLLERSGFRDCAAEKGLLPTWPSGLPAPLRIRIDHCLTSSEVSVTRIQVGESVGSDHLATINDLSVASP